MQATAKMFSDVISKHLFSIFLRHASISLAPSTTDYSAYLKKVDLFSIISISWKIDVN